MVEEFDFFTPEKDALDDAFAQETSQAASSLALTEDIFAWVHRAQFIKVHNPEKRNQFLALCEKSKYLAKSCFAILRIEQDDAKGVGEIKLKFPTRWGCTMNEEGINETMAELLCAFPQFSIHTEGSAFIVMVFHTQFYDLKQVRNHSRLLEVLRNCMNVNREVSEE